MRTINGNSAADSDKNNENIAAAAVFSSMKWRRRGREAAIKKSYDGDSAAKKSCCQKGTKPQPVSSVSVEKLLHSVVVSSAARDRDGDEDCPSCGEEIEQLLEKLVFFCFVALNLFSFADNQMKMKIFLVFPLFFEN
jgi:hypothetical protein